VIYNKFTSNGSELRLAENHKSGMPNLVSSQEVNSPGENTNNSENNNNQEEDV
jgi:hypothetical protein